MKKNYILILILVLVLALSSCSSMAQPADGCESLQPQNGDIQYALNFGSNLFTETDWQRSYMVQDLKAYVSWTHRSVPAIADVSMLLFCDEGGTKDVGSWYFTPENVQSMFLDYDQTAITKSCGVENLLLYELEAVEENVKYDIRLWAKTFNDTRVLTVLVVFPDNQKPLLGTYSQEFFPELPACP